MKKSILLILCAGFFLGCESANIPRGTPSCIKDLIKSISKEPVRNPPAKIYSYTYQGSTVYYVTPRCCDIPSTLIDEKCNSLCAPDGGLGGGGDGRCSDFFASRTDQKLIWEDKRK
ncbi:DUF6970 domain-containing protein [Rhabdobacter roseus]|uniref:DUF6970 domain-containing protein n=1 Tax=Rhabdobacter roseus TaxID=1655419 RepID=UPI003CCD3AE9